MGKAIGLEKVTKANPRAVRVREKAIMAKVGGDRPKARECLVQPPLLLLLLNNRDAKEGA
jgi:hypothetical protein